MAKRVLDRLRTIMRLFLTWRFGKGVLRALVIVMALLVLSSATLALDPDAKSFPMLRQWTEYLGLASETLCDGFCQGCYCDAVVNGQCYVGGRPSGCIGCVGACTGDHKCSCKAGVGGCGAVLAWCRDSDCSPKPPPTPAVPPTPTAVPPACDEGKIFTKLELPAVVWKHEPDYPVAVQQDPTFRGFDLIIDVKGGFAEERQSKLEQVCSNGQGLFPKDCPDEAWRWSCSEKVLRHFDDPVLKVDVPMRLADSTVAWIEGDLRSRYYNAQRKEPLPKTFEIWRGESMSIHTGIFDYKAQDPGVHGGKIIVETKGTPLSEPQRVAIPYSVPVYLRDTTLSK